MKVNAHLESPIATHPSLLVKIRHAVAFAKPRLSSQESFFKFEYQNHMLLIGAVLLVLFFVREHCICKEVRSSKNFKLDFPLR